MIAAVPFHALGQAGSPAPSPQPRTLSQITVTATRIDALAFDVPASIDRIEGDEARAGRAQTNISEMLGTVPGLQARDRQNYAQDVQISVRGFGARSTFGIRGVRLYVDGIPATLPDGQGQISHVDLGTIGRIEVLRGPFSALYGNSSGGVIQVFTEEGRGAPQVQFDVSAGSDGALRFGTKASGQSGGIGYVASISRFQTDGYREHSSAERNLGNLKLTTKPDDDSKVTLIANSLSLPQADDPLGLTRAQWAANPRGVDPSALAFNTRKAVHQTQLGLVYDRRVDAANALQLTTYLGRRTTVQYQSIPVATQANALHPGGVIDLGRDYRGADLRWTHQTRLLGAPLTLVGGVAYDDLNEQRRGFQNFSGATLGVTGALRRDEKNDVSNADQYLQGSWAFAPQWSLTAGLRHSQIRFRSRDQYIAGSNPDDSGSTRYSATLPVVGLMYAASREVHLFATAGRGFETPTLNEIAYRSGGGTGLNLGLQSSRSKSFEAGVKTRSAQLGELTAAVFATGTDDEIVTQTNVGGRSTFQNAGATRRNGLELGWSNDYFDNVRAQVAYSVLRARYADAFTTCAATPCTTPTQRIAAGNRIPGVAPASLFASLAWAPPLGWRAGAEMRYVGKVYANDANTDAAPAYAVAAAYAGYKLQEGPWEWSGLLRVDNLFDRRYAGSVIVNEGNGRFFEPAPGRTWLLAMSATRRF
ncbi:TonB-dependent siderophore receptor [Rhodoferax koreense]|uniref:TonB-dependent siderophore receptor n=1 Tax=Rhodoferax koreensis TaxID=1842727 RepID=A0A1P8K341_9BURK|nr:TonB-dependent siderophore receptor [Rhodoferax koreense]